MFSAFMLSSILLVTGFTVTLDKANIPSSGIIICSSIDGSTVLVCVVGSILNVVIGTFIFTSLLLTFINTGK